MNDLPEKEIPRLTSARESRFQVVIGRSVLEDIRTHSNDIHDQVVYRKTMPIGGGPSDGERERVGVWLDCGAP